MIAREGTRARRALAVGLALVACVCALVLSGATSGLTGPSGALGQGPAPEVTPQTDAAVPAHEVVMLGSSPQEAPAETWGIGKVGAQSRATWSLVRYTAETGWMLAPALGASGGALSGFAPAAGSLAGSIAPDGGGALLGEVTTPTEGGESEHRQVLLVRDPEQSFTETSSEPPLSEGQHLFDPDHTRAPMVAALEEEGNAGALVVPVATGSEAEETSVLHWSGTTHAWTSERIEIPQQSREGRGFRVLAIAASSLSNAWLLGQLGEQSDAVALFRREQSAGVEVWRPVAVSGEAPGAPLRVPLAGGASTQFTVTGLGEPPTSQSQLLTVSGAAESGSTGSDRTRRSA